jgi:tetratricopeptide (TPR) repeat protein
LDGIPLAIELAAARIKLLRVEQIAERLGDRFQLLTGGGRTALARHQTLAALIDWSHDLLTEPERILLRRLSVFAGGWMLEAAEAVCVGDSIEQSHVLDLLTQLVNKSLVIAERKQGADTRYRMLETIRQYAMEKLTASGEVDTIQRRHAEYYLTQAQANVFAPGLYQLEQKHDNMRTALVWCLSDTGDAELGLHLAAAMTLGMFLPAEACRWLEAALARADTLVMVATFARADALLALGTMLAYQGDFAAGRAHMTQSLKVFQELGERSRIAFALNRLGWLAREQGDPIAARAQLEKSIALNRELGNKVRIAWGLVTLGEVAVLREEDTTWAVSLLEEGLALMKEQKGARGVLGAGWALNHLGHIAQVRGETARARLLHENSISLFQQLEEQPLGIVWGFQSLGETALAEGKAAIAAGHFANALGLSQDGGFRAETAWCLAGLAGVAALNEEPERAAWLWGAAEALRQSIGAREAPASRATHERLKNEVRQQLGEAAFHAKWAEGQAASVNQAIDEALRQ